MKFVRKVIDTSRPRYVKRFALFPITIYYTDKVETRWMETVYLKQTYSDIPKLGGWQNEKFVKESEFKYYTK
jgi:hypothetical protein